MNDAEIDAWLEEQYAIEVAMEQENAVRYTPLVDIMAARNKTHGDYEYQADICQRLKQVMYDSLGWESLTYVQKDALEMVAVKTSRILTGDPNHRDSWIDGAGYFTLGANSVEE